MKTHQTVLIGWLDDTNSGLPQGHEAEVVEGLADYLMSKGF